MQQYPVKSRNHPPLTADRIEEIARRDFTDVVRDGGSVKGAFGAIAEIRCWVEGKSLGVDLRMNPAVEAPVQSETIRRYNRFLEELTGFSSKERAKRLKKSATPAEG